MYCAVACDSSTGLNCMSVYAERMRMLGAQGVTFHENLW